MKRSLTLVICLLTARVALAQPFPVPHDQSQGPAVTYDAQGRRYETFQKPGGGSVTYGPGGERYDTFEQVGGGSVTYGPQGERWETFSDPAMPQHSGQDGRP